MIIAEIGQAHDGSLGNAFSYIDALSDTGIDAIKFQTHISSAESSIYEPFRIKFSKQDKTRFEYWKRMEFTYDQWSDLKEHCESYGIEFISSPFSNAAVDILEKIDVKRYKIGSGEISNFLMLEKIGRTGKPIILSSGLSNYEELDRTIEFLSDFKSPISILQCTTSYPTKSHQWGLNQIDELKKRYSIPVGFSDHSGAIYASLAATALGAEIIEVHVVFDKKQFGPDTSSSITIKETSKMVKGIRDIRKAINNPVNKNNIDNETNNLKNIFEKSLAVNKDMKKESIIHFDDLESKKPSGYGINPKDYKKLIGKKINKDLKKWSFLTSSDLND